MKYTLTQVLDSSFDNLNTPNRVMITHKHDDKPRLYLSKDTSFDYVGLEDVLLKRRPAVDRF